jgi:hypothetical protein
MKVLVVYHSLYRDVLQLARAVEEGVKSVPGVEAVRLIHKRDQSLFPRRRERCNPR